MNKFTKKFRSLLILILALTMVFTSLMSVACKKKGTSSDDETEETTTITERTDNQVLKNGDFEFGTANTAVTSYPASPTGWSKSYDSISESNATTSSYASGIIDTRTYKYEYDEDGYVLLDDEGNPVLAKDEDGNYIKVFDTIASSNAFPKYAYEYTTSTDDDGNEVRTYKKDDNGNFIPKLDGNGNNVEADSLDTEYFYYNPGTPFDNDYISESEYDADDETNISKGGKILMIHNKVVASDGQGTAQYYKSSTTLSLGIGESGVLEAWVLTKDLTSNMKTEYGAYVLVSSTVGSIDAGETVIQNINTYGRWSKIQIYVQGSDFAKTTLTVTLGLGFGSSAFTYKYAEGFAFFDNVHFKTLKASEVPADETASLNKVVSLYNASKELVDDETRYDYNYTEENFKALDESNFLTTTLKINAKKDLTALQINGSSKKENVYESNSADSKFNLNATATVTDNVLTFNYPNPSTLSFETDAFAVNYNENIRLSFYVKTELLNVTNSTNGLTVYLMDKGKSQTAEGTEVSLLSDFKTTKGENKDNDDFTLVSVIVSNTYSDDVRYFSLKFVLGSTETSDRLETLPKGSATIKDFKTITLSEDEASNLSTSDEAHATKRTLQSEYATLPSESTSSDSYTFSYGLPNKQTITYKAVADVQNYEHLIGGTNRTGGSKDLQYNHPTDTAGLINSEYIDNYSDSLFTVGSTNYKAKIKTWLEKVAKANDNDYAQPLMINNDNCTFGYIGNSLSLNASTTYLITVKVKIFGDATAYVYLSDMDDTYNAILSVDAKTNEHTNETITKGQYGYAIALTAKDVNANEKDGFASVQFLITTGKHEDTARNYRIEMWNGSRDGETPSTGIVFFDGVVTTTSTDRNVNLRDFKYTYTTEKAFMDGENGYDYTYATAESKKISFTQLPTLIKTDANPDGVTTNYEKTDSDHTSVIFMTNGTLENGIVKGGTFIISDLTSVDALLEVDNTTSDDDSSSSDDTTDTSSGDSTSYSPFLFATSLIVSVALIIALVAVLVKHIITAHRRKKFDRESYYDTSAREKAHEKILNKKAVAEKEAKKDYDYDNPENNVDFEENVTVEDIQAENAEVSENIEAVLEETEVEVEEETSSETEETSSEEAPVETETPSDESND